MSGTPNHRLYPEYTWHSRLYKPREKEFEHTKSNFENISTQRSHFTISPEWVSEIVTEATPFGRRRYRPWPYEFQGARHWPCGVDEPSLPPPETRRPATAPGSVGRKIETRPMTDELRIRPTLMAPTRLLTRPSYTPFRPCTSAERTFGCHGDRVHYGNDCYHATNDNYMNDEPQEDSMYVNNSGCQGDVIYGNHDVNGFTTDRLPLLFPEEKPVRRYMNFVNSQWIQ